MTCLCAGRHEVLANWIRVCLFGDGADIEDRVKLSNLLDQLGILPAHTWELADVALLDRDVVGLAYLSATVHAIVRRNPILAEVLRTWERIHGHTFEQVVVENGEHDD
jgi:hypothetical protein